MKPILFNTEMVRAILEGRKTCTRRVVKGPPPHATHVPSPCPWVAWETDGEMWHIKPPFFPGDVLYVRETWSCWRAHRYEATADIQFKAGGPGVTLHFANGNTDSVDRSDFDAFTKKWFSYSGKWFPSIHMPKKAARIFLRVTNVRAERLQSITEVDAQKEGSGKFHIVREIWSYRRGFQKIWDNTVKPADLPIYGWDASPWVWVIEFERCEKPEVE